MSTGPHLHAEIERTRVQLSPNDRGDALKLVVDGVDLSCHALADGFKIELDTSLDVTRPVVTVKIPADDFAFDFPNAKVVFEGDESK